MEGETGSPRFTASFKCDIMNQKAGRKQRNSCEYFRISSFFCRKAFQSDERCGYMSRREFINLLTDSLAGRVPGRLISEKADYYRRHITERAQETGRTEEEVIEELGPPELIAHTIVDVYEAENGVYRGGVDAPYSEYTDTDSRKAADEDGRGRFFHFNMGGNGCLLISFLVVFVFLVIAIWMVRFIAAYPVLVIAAVLMLYLWMEYKKRH